MKPINLQPPRPEGVVAELDTLLTIVQDEAMLIMRFARRVEHYQHMVLIALRQAQAGELKAFHARARLRKMEAQQRLAGAERRFRLLLAHYGTAIETSSNMQLLILAQYFAGQRQERKAYENAPHKNAGL